MMLAPNLYKQTRYKFRTVSKELSNMNWIRNLRQVNTKALMDEFILLFTALNDVILTEERDTIAWKWTRTRQYSVVSAYDIQILGAFPKFKASSIWKAKTKAKCRFFAWLTIWKKVPTADNLLKKNWPCGPMCPLCFCMPETNDHLLMECNFTEAVWDKVASDCHLHPTIIPFQKGDIKDWVSSISRAGSKAEQQEYAGIMLFFWWFIWKERDQRIFYLKECSGPQVANLIKDALITFHRALLPS
jgi:hypothetical protein